MLSGKLFSGGSRSSSPERSPSPDAVKWPDDTDYDSEQESRDNIKKALQSQGDMDQQDSIGMGPGRTGVKGVIRDRNEAESTAKSNQVREFEEMNKKMEKASLGGLTFLEEENLRIAEKARQEDWEDVLTFKSAKGKFGHLREVGLEGFLKSVEQEARGVWVVVHLYVPVGSIYSVGHGSSGAHFTVFRSLHSPRRNTESSGASISFSQVPEGKSWRTWLHVCAHNFNEKVFFRLEDYKICIDARKISR